MNKDPVGARGRKRRITPAVLPLSEAEAEGRGKEHGGKRAHGPQGVPPVGSARRKDPLSAAGAGPGRAMPGEEEPVVNGEEMSPFLCEYHHILGGIVPYERHAEPYPEIGLIALIGDRVSGIAIVEGV